MAAPRVIRGIGVPIVFVSRPTQPGGSAYWPADKGGPRDMPGVGPRNRVRPAPPGRLLVLEADGKLRTLVDGGKPTPASLQLVDVNGPSVSYDGKQIVFAGLPMGDYSNVEYAPDHGTQAVGAWRIYMINADGTGLHRVTSDDKLHTEKAFSEQFGEETGKKLLPYDDFDPLFLPTGAICFSSTRSPSFTHFGDQRTSQLYTMRADGTGLRRMTSERNGADRPTLDPLSGEVVYARWWRNMRYPTNFMGTVKADPAALPASVASRPGVEAYAMNMGLKSSYDPRPEEGDDLVYRGDSLQRTQWHAARIRPDGYGLGMFTGYMRSPEDIHYYGGSFSDDGTLYANFFPVVDMTRASGFGGVRRMARGPGKPVGIAGVTGRREDHVSNDPAGTGKPSIGIYKSLYAADPIVLPDDKNGGKRTGKLLLSMTAKEGDLTQDYGLYVMDREGGAPEAVLDIPGTAELRAQVLLPRAMPQVMIDIGATGVVPQIPPPDVPTRPTPEEVVKITRTGIFRFQAVNVYANADVDVDMVSAMPVGSAHTIRGFVDYQRHSPGTIGATDWPILLEEVAIDAGGAATLSPPSNVPLFEDVRDAQGRVVATGGHYGGKGRESGAAFVSGLNYGPTGSHSHCLGCHAGHSMLVAPDDDEEGKWTNLAPGARVILSSVDDESLREQMEASIVDRRVKKAPDMGLVWRSAEASGLTGQWAELHFPVPVWAREIRLYNQIPEQGATPTDIVIDSALVRFFDDDDAKHEIGKVTVRGPLGVKATSIDVHKIAQPKGIRVVRVEILSAHGTTHGKKAVSLGEVEVISRGDPPPPPGPKRTAQKE